MPAPVSSYLFAPWQAGLELDVGGVEVDQASFLWAFRCLGGPVTPTLSATRKIQPVTSPQKIVSGSDQVTRSLLPRSERSETIQARPVPTLRELKRWIGSWEGWNVGDNGMNARLPNSGSTGEWNGDTAA